MKKILNYSLFLLILLSFSCSKDDEVLEEVKPLHEAVVGNLNSALNFTALPDAMVVNTNETSKEAVTAFDDLVRIADQVVTFLEVPKTTISSDITNNKESFSWLDNLFGDTVEVNYEIKKESDRYVFSYKATKGDFSLEFIKGNTLLDENAGIFIINEGNTIGSLSWEITEKDLIIELLFEGKTTLTYNKTDKSGTLISGDVTYQWNEDGSGSLTDRSLNTPVVKTW